MRQNLKKKLNIIISTIGAIHKPHTGRTLQHFRYSALLKFLKIDDSSNGLFLSYKHEKSKRRAQILNNDLIHTDLSTTTYCNKYSSNNIRFQYNSDSTFILSNNLYKSR